MGNIRKLQKNLSKKKVWLANRVQTERIEIVRQKVADKAAKDPLFAAELIKEVGDKLPDDIRKVAEMSIANDLAKSETT